MAKPWVFSFTPTELWEQLEKLTDASYSMKDGAEIPPLKVGMRKMQKKRSRKSGPFVCPSVTVTVPNRIPPRITGGIRLMRKEWLKKPVEIRSRPPSRRWMKIANRRPAGEVKAVTARRPLEARETRANAATEALQKNLKMEMLSPIPPRVVVEKAIFPREKANPVANSRDIPRE